MDIYKNLILWVKENDEEGNYKMDNFKSGFPLS
jgi:hypothetical protein